jgi:hypothetical protein
MFPKNSFAGVWLAIFALCLSLTAGASAQSKRSANSKTAVAKKAESKGKDASKEHGKSKAKAAAKDDKRDKANAKDKAKDKDKAKSKAKEEANAKADAKNRKDPKRLAELKKAEAERRRKEEERRQAIIEERRRREQAAREARERRLAFERGLHTETIANILNDKTAGEDMRIRQAAISALGGHAGSVVVMEAQTGKVLTIVNQDWAVRSTIRPCSTIKLVTGVAALNEGVISKDDGSVRNISTRRNLDDAIAFSDNGYFQRAGMQIGNEKLVEYGKALGLGEPTGLNVDGEAPGRLPVSNGNARIYSHGDDTEVSTIQLAVLAAAITNGGHRVLPRIPRNAQDNAEFRPFYKANVELPQVNVRRVIPGMMGAAEYGTARRNMDQNLGVAGKTGSCIDKGSWVGLFASVAPIEKPKYAVAVITRGQGERGKYAAAVAAEVYRSLAPQIVRTDRNLAQTEFNIRPRNQAEIITAGRTADADEDDDSASVGTEGADENANEGGDLIAVPRAPRATNQKKLVTKTADSRPLFPPVIITYDREGNPLVNGVRPKP